MPTAISYLCYPLVMGITLITALWAAAEPGSRWPLLGGVAAAGIAAVAVMERLVPYDRTWLADRGDFRADVLHGMVNWTLLGTAAFLVSVGTNATALPSLWPSTWPLWAQLGLVAVIFDVGLYAMHVLSHRWPWAWRLHAIHHSSERLYWLNGERRHPVSAGLMAAPGLLVLALLAAPPVLVSAWLAVVAVHLAFQHANLDYRLGPLRRWIAGAETHRWHHKRDYEDAQVNFGEFLLVWDRLFGTFVEPAGLVRSQDVGLRRSDVPSAYLAQLRWPFAMPAELRQAFNDRLAAGDAELRAGRADAALIEYEAAHILGQAWTGAHVRSHWAILGLALNHRRLGEILGQLSRITAAAVFTWLWVPLGNPGTIRVRALARHPISDDLAAVLARTSQ